MLEHAGRDSLESACAASRLHQTRLSTSNLRGILPLQITAAVYALRRLAIWKFSSRCYSSTPLPSAMVVCTRGRAHKSTTGSVVRPTFTIPQVGLPPNLYFHRVQLNSDTAKENILRLFFRKESTPKLFGPYSKSDEDAFKWRSSIKHGLCLKLSASRPNSLQRIRALPDALDSLRWCLRDVLKGEETITEDQEDVISQMQQRFDRIITSPDFVTRTSDKLFAEFFDTFPNNSPTQEDVPDSLLLRSYSVTREEVGMHLDRSFANSCYDKERTDSDWSRDAGSLLSECLNFDHKDSIAYWVGSAPGTSVNARAQATLGI
jgi:hypothetical protein